MASSKADRAICLISEIEEDTRKRTIADVLIDLRDYTGPERDTEGYAAAIDVISSNYPI